MAKAPVLHIPVEITLWPSAALSSLSLNPSTWSFEGKLTPIDSPGASVPQEEVEMQNAGHADWSADNKGGGNGDLEVSVDGRRYMVAADQVLRRGSMVALNAQGFAVPAEAKSVLESYEEAMVNTRKAPEPLYRLLHESEVMRAGDYGRCASDHAALG